MGNSVRSTLGNLCGAEASKDLPADDDTQKPVARPKEKPKSPKAEKKKEKKNNRKKKKTRKNKKDAAVDGDAASLDKIDEESDTSKDTSGHGNESQNSEYKPGGATTEPAGGDESKNETTTEENGGATVGVTLKDLSNSTTGLMVANGDDDGDDAGSEASHSEEADDDDHGTMTSLPSRRSSAPIGLGGPSRLVFKSQGSELDVNDADAFYRGGSTTSSQMSFGSSPTPPGPAYEHVASVVPEELSIGYADDIFKKCCSKYRVFVDKVAEFKQTVNKFKSSVSPSTTVQNEGLPCDCNYLDDCFRAYVLLLEKEQRRESNSATEDEEVVDMSEVNVCLQSLRANGNELLETISAVRPQVDSLIDEAAHVDVIEYVKGKMVEGVQLGITSKFSAPGKYRRNMKNLRKALASMDAVEEDVKRLLEDSLFDEHDDADRRSEYDNDEIGIRLPKTPTDGTDADNESDIVPVSKTEDLPIVDDLFSKLDRLDGSEDEGEDVFEKEDGSGANYERKLMTPDKKTNLDDPENPDNRTLLEQSIEASRIPGSPETMMFVIDKEGGGSGSGTKNNTSTPTGPSRGVDPLAKNPIQQVIVEEEEHNTLDFGKYVLVDPNTGDIAVMRNRSRSLDSLVSIQSNRSSMSKFGSFELVTDFEINIAEKNQQSKQ